MSDDTEMPPNWLDLPRAKIPELPTQPFEKGKRLVGTKRWQDLPKCEGNELPPYSVCAELQNAR